MGGDGLSSVSDESSLTDQDVLHTYDHHPILTSRKLDDVNAGNEECELGFGYFEEVGYGNHLEFEANKRRKCKAYNEVLQSYHELRSRVHSLTEEKTKLLSYTPGALMEKMHGMDLSDYYIPNTATLLLVGPKGSGKSSLVNRISKVLEDDKFAPDRAQVSYNYSAGEGTYFLQEYNMPRGSTSFCLYDTRGLSDDSNDNIKMLKDWMTKGVCQGELILRPHDNSNLRARMKGKARGNCGQSNEIRMVNFVIFVVSGLAVLKSMDKELEENEYAQTISMAFNSPYLSFQDDKPVVVVTHGDLLSLSDRARVRVYLGELLGVPPTKQIFDIPETGDPVTELTVIDMLHYSLQHVDKNFLQKNQVAEKVYRVRGSLSACMYLLIILGIAIISVNIQRMHNRRAQESVHINWHAIRHLWLE